jgi:GNAT superfamily N-acetyltransferase
MYKVLHEISFVSRLKERINMAEHKLSIVELSEENLHILEDGLRQFSLSKTTEENIPVNVLVKNNEDTVIGALQGNYNTNWLYVNAIWVDSPYRAQGLGKKMMLEVEAEAAKRGVRHSFLQTIHSLGFYQKLGYEIFAVIEDCPAGFNLYYLKKKLIP